MQTIFRMLSVYIAGVSLFAWLCDDAVAQRTHHDHSGGVRHGGVRHGNTIGSGLIVVPGLGTGHSTYAQHHSPSYSSSQYNVHHHGTSAGHLNTYSTPPHFRQYAAHANGSGYRQISPIRNGVGYHVYSPSRSGLSVQIYSNPGYGPGPGNSYSDGLNYGLNNPYVYGLNYGFDPFGIYGYGYNGIYLPPIVLPYGSAGVPWAIGTRPFPANDFAASSPSLLTTPPQPMQLPQANTSPVLPNISGLDLQLSRPLAADEQGVVNEFGNTASLASEKPVSTVERIQSLRYQTSGDDAFHRQEYDRAEVFYRTAVETAPGRQASWLRLTWSQVAQQRFPEAVASLKQALVLPDDPTSAWIPGKELYGTRINSDASLHNDELWNWLQQRPQSTDRLLLVSAFQQLRGNNGVARELLEAAAVKGLSQSLVKAMQDIAQDINAPAPGDLMPNGQPNGQPLPPVGDASRIGNMKITDGILSTDNAADDGIRLFGRNGVPSTTTQPPLPSDVQKPPAVGAPQPLSDGDNDEAIPVPVETTPQPLQPLPESEPAGAAGLLVPAPIPFN